MQLNLASGSYLNSYEKQVYKHTGQGLPAVDTRIMQALLPMPDSTAAVSPVNYIILQMNFSTNLRENFLNRTITPQLGELLAAEIFAVPLDVSGSKVKNQNVLSSRRRPKGSLVIKFNPNYQLCRKISIPLRKMVKFLSFRSDIACFY